MTARQTNHHVVLQADALTIAAPSGRVLVADLDLVLEREHVAIVGRNGVGKSSLLRVLAGQDEPTTGHLHRPGSVGFVPQELPGDPAASPGERRRRLLAEVGAQAPDLLLLDEPTEDLDIDGIDWLCDWLRTYPGATLVVSHHRQLLRGFEHFFVLEESGCRHVHGDFDALERELEERHQRGQQRYASKLSHLEARERRDVTIRRRRRRKKNLGRLHEEARGVSRARLGEKKSYAQGSQAKAAKIRSDRLAADRAWTRAARRALAVRLPLELAIPALPRDDGEPRVAVEALEVEVAGRRVIRGLDLTLGRERLAILGPNGAGKSTLLAVLRGDLAPCRGRVVVHPRLGAIAQGATDWMRPESLVEVLLDDDPSLTPDRAVAIATAHAFPLGLALRPLATLSAGERTRAALIALFQRAPELLLLDEPTYSLDFVGASALAQSLAQWPGALVVATHDRAFLEDVGITRSLRLTGQEPGVVSMTSPP